jgi:hypothetical protein
MSIFFSENSRGAPTVVNIYIRKENAKKQTGSLEKIKEEELKEGPEDPGLSRREERGKRTGPSLILKMFGVMVGT